MDVSSASHDPGAEEGRGVLEWVNPKDIRSSPFGDDVNPIATPEEDRALEASVREEGVKIPLVCHRNASGALEVVAGTRRLKYAQIHGVEKVPILVLKFESDEAKRQFALKDNLERRQLSSVAKAALALVYWKSLEIAPEKKVGAREGFTPRRRAAETAGIGDGTLANYRFVIDSGFKDIIDAMQSGKMTINAAYNKSKTRVKEMEEPDSDPPSSSSASALDKVGRVIADVKAVVGSIKALAKLSERLYGAVDSAAKCGAAEKRKLLKRVAEYRELIVEAKSSAALDCMMDALEKFESGLR